MIVSVQFCTYCTISYYIIIIDIHWWSLYSVRTKWRQICWEPAHPCAPASSQVGGGLVGTRQPLLSRDCDHQDDGPGICSIMFHTITSGTKKSFHEFLGEDLGVWKTPKSNGRMPSFCSMASTSGSAIAQHEGSDSDWFDCAVNMLRTWCKSKSRKLVELSELREL